MKEMCHFPVATDRKFLLISHIALPASTLEWYKFQNRVLAKKYQGTC